jgi:hypothetical protein
MLKHVNSKSEQPIGIQIMIYELNEPKLKITYAESSGPRTEISTNLLWKDTSIT